MGIRCQVYIYTILYIITLREDVPRLARLYTCWGVSDPEQHLLPWWAFWQFKAVQELCPHVCSHCVHKSAGGGDHPVLVFVPAYSARDLWNCLCAQPLTPVGHLHASLIWDETEKWADQAKHSRSCEHTMQSYCSFQRSASISNFSIKPIVYYLHLLSDVSWYDSHKPTHKLQHSYVNCYVWETGCIQILRCLNYLRVMFLQATRRVKSTRYYCIASVPFVTIALTASREHNLFFVVQAHCHSITLAPIIAELLHMSRNTFVTSKDTVHCWNTAWKVISDIVVRVLLKPKLSRSCSITSGSCLFCGQEQLSWAFVVSSEWHLTSLVESPAVQAWIPLQHPWDTILDYTGRCSKRSSIAAHRALLCRAQLLYPHSL